MKKSIKFISVLIVLVIFWFSAAAQDSKQSQKPAKNKEAKLSANKKTTVGTLNIPDGQIYYEVQGKGKPVVLLHAGGMDSKMWDAQFDQLARQFRVVRYDLRGFGRSSKPDKPFHPVDDLYNLLKHLGIKRANLIGLSMGSGVALNFALEYPKMVEKLVLASMSGPPRNLPPEAQIAMPKGSPIFERLKDVSPPTLLLIGEKDVSSAKMAEKVEKEIPKIRKVILPEIGHFLNLEKQELFNRELIGFLQEQ